MSCSYEVKKKLPIIYIFNTLVKIRHQYKYIHLNNPSTSTDKFLFFKAVTKYGNFDTAGTPSYASWK